MVRPFTEFVNQFDEEYIANVADEFTKSINKSISKDGDNLIRLEDLATFSSAMSHLVTLNYLREYHEWLHQDENQTQPDQ